MLWNLDKNRFLTATFCALTMAFGTVAVAPEAGAYGDDDDSDGAMHSLDSVDTGETHDLDDVDTGHTDSLDSVDTGRTHSLDSVDTGHTDSLDSVDSGRTHALDPVDTGHTESLDSVDERAYEHDEPPAAPAPMVLPEVENGNWEAQASRAKAIIATAEKRLGAANTTYAKMMRNDYPRGDARAQIIADRATAERDLNEAWDHLGRIKKRARDAGRPL